jgi:penicillin-binding protein 1B
VTVRAALEQSLNVPTVRAALRVGIDRVVATARAAGIASPLKPLPSLALGTSEVTPLELASGYATLARLGRAGRPWVIREIVDDAGEPLLRPRVAWTRAMRPQSAYLVNHLLRGVIQRGTARSAVALGYRGDAAGKTGTTDDTRDAWFVGYSRDLLALVWVGYDDGAPTGLTGATGALPIWVDLMRRAGRAADHVSDAVPEGIVAVRIDPESGGRARRGCPHWIEERFAAGSAPRHDCPLHGGRFRHWLDRFRRPRSDVARDGV